MPLKHKKYYEELRKQTWHTKKLLELCNFGTDSCTEIKEILHLS
jgi:hypothetical protein